MPFFRGSRGYLRQLALSLALILPTPGLADGWSALNEPDTFGLMRHALAPGTSDPAGFRLDDCSTQRNLDARGRAQAAAIGETLRAKWVRIDHVLSSAWCRCRETAELLGLGAVQIAPELNSFFQNREDGAAQTTATLALLDRLDGPAILVTHQVNITALAGVFPRSGEIVVVRVSDGSLTVVERFLIED